MIDITYKGKTVNMPLEKHGKQVAMIEVKVLDYKNSYGNLRFLVEPLGGKGQFWVNADNLVKK